jgi:regulation of enolase protein 1 (concanavalin A-like superfamily)
MAIIFAVIVPQFRIVRKTWDSQVGITETIQNSRVLVDHISRNLSKAGKITAVSGSSITNGYIEFEDNNANNFRYDVNGLNDYVEYGPVGSLADLAGPVSKLQFTCYDANDFDTPVTDVNSIRFVKTEITLNNQAPSGRDKTFTTHSYIRSNLNYGRVITKGTPFEYDVLVGETPALAQIDSTHYLCTYRGGTGGSKGISIVLEVDTDTWEVSQASSSPFEYESEVGEWPALAKINQEHYLCAYQGRDDDGWAKILKVYLPHWTISQNASLEFDPSEGKTPALVQIDQTHYLCAYSGAYNDGWAVVLSVAWPLFNSISMGTPFEFDIYHAATPALAKIDYTHYLCVYADGFSDGQAVVLIVNPGTWNITKGTPFQYDTLDGQTPALLQIDGTHYICAYAGPVNTGRAVVLTVDTGDWSISKETTFEYDSTTGITPNLAQVDQYNYLFAYTGQASAGYAVVLTVDPGDWTISKGETFKYESTVATTPDLAKIGSDSYLCASTGLGNDGWSVILKLEDEVRP